MILIGIESTQLSGRRFQDMRGQSKSMVGYELCGLWVITALAVCAVLAAFDFIVSGAIWTQLAVFYIFV
jgi:hypothetical protein